MHTVAATEPVTRAVHPTAVASGTSVGPAAAALLVIGAVTAIRKSIPALIRRECYAVRLLELNHRLWQKGEHDATRQHEAAGAARPERVIGHGSPAE